MIDSLTQGHLLPMMAPAAILRRVGRIHFDELSASFFRFAREFVKELRPRGIGNAFGQAMGMNHAVDAQVFYAHGPELVDDLPGLLMREVVSSEGNTLI